MAAARFFRVRRYAGAWHGFRRGIFHGTLERTQSVGAVSPTICFSHRAWRGRKNYANRSCHDHAPNARWRDANDSDRQSNAHRTRRDQNDETEFARPKGWRSDHRHRRANRARTNQGKIDSRAQSACFDANVDWTIIHLAIFPSILLRSNS